MGKKNTLNLTRQCDLRQLPLSSYYRPKSSLTEGPDNLKFMKVIDEELLKHPFYGSRKMTACLIRKSTSVNRKWILLLVRLLSLESISPIPNTRIVLQKRQSAFAN